MSFKFKNLSLLGFVLLAALLSAPFASASEWTRWNGSEQVPLVGEEIMSESFEGNVQLTAAPPVIPTHAALDCQVTVQILAEAGSTGMVTSFSPTTASCNGSGIFEGCKVTSHTIDTPWNLDISEAPATIWSELQISLWFEGCKFGILESHLEFWTMDASFSTGWEGKLTGLSLSGTSKSGVKISGSLEPEFSPLLGLK